MLAKKASKIMLANKDANKYFKDKDNIIITGNPIRKDILTESKEDSRKKLGLDNRPVILSFGGSLGARKINEAIIDLIVDTSKDNRFQHIHAYGQYGSWFIPSLEERGIKLSEHKNLDIREYIKDMPTCLAAADVVISRAGAITLSEIQAQGKASILIPSPNVAENHQYYNAMALVNNKAAQIIEEKDLTGDTLINKVNDMLSSPSVIKEYQYNAKKMSICDANERIYSIINEVLKV